MPERVRVRAPFLYGKTRGEGRQSSFALCGERILFPFVRRGNLRGAGEGRQDRDYARDGRKSIAAQLGGKSVAAQRGGT